MASVIGTSQPRFTLADYTVELAKSGDAAECANILRARERSNAGDKNVPEKPEDLEALVNSDKGEKAMEYFDGIFNDKSGQEFILKLVHKDGYIAGYHQYLFLKQNDPRMNDHTQKVMTAGEAHWELAGLHYHPKHQEVKPTLAIMEVALKIIDEGPYPERLHSRWEFAANEVDTVKDANGPFRFTLVNYPEFAREKNNLRLPKGTLE